MDYQRIYNELIQRSQQRETEGFVERHHIVPKCLGGSDEIENIVRLTPEEHYVAHQLLVKIYPSHQGLAFAAHMMGTTRKGNKTYGWLRRKVAQAMSENNHWQGRKHKEITKAKISASNTGKRRTDEQKAKLKGRAAPNKGVPCSEEQRAKLRGMKRTPEQCNRISEAKKGQLTDALLQSLQTQHEKNRGSKRSEETKRKMSEARKLWHAQKRLASQPQ